MRGATLCPDLTRNPITKVPADAEDLADRPAEQRGRSKNPGSLRLLRAGASGSWGEAGGRPIREIGPWDD